MDTRQHIYLIRHGQTDHNGQRIFQSDDAPLNEAGLSQAEQAARILNRHTEIVISSPLMRAQQTAQVIANRFKCPLQIAPALTEIKNPPIIRGRSYDDPDADAIYVQWCTELVNPKACSVDGAENYHDLIVRARQFLSLVNKRQEQTLAIVTHSEFIRAILFCIMLENEASPKSFKHFKSHIKVPNGSVIHLSANKSGRRVHKLVFN